MSRIIQNKFAILLIALLIINVLFLQIFEYGWWLFFCFSLWFLFIYFIWFVVYLKLKGKHPIILVIIVLINFSNIFLIQTAGNIILTLIKWAKISKY